MSKRRVRKVDERQLDLLDWLEAQPEPKVKKPRIHAVGTDTDIDEDQLDLVDLILERGQAA